MSNEYINPNELVSSQQIDPDEHVQFKRKIRELNALTTADRKNGNFNADKAIAESDNSMKALNAQGVLQEMLIAQMTSIHALQQMTIALANTTGFMDSKQFYTNSAVKLSNAFTQQASLLAKLQGVGGQKIVVQHMVVRDGGQAIVGHVNTTGRGTDENTKSE